MRVKRVKNNGEVVLARSPQVQELIAKYEEYKNHLFFDEDTVVDRRDYVPVCQGRIPNELIHEAANRILEHLFEVFNIRHPENYVGRSMSSGDVIMLKNGDNRKYYLCLSIGWKLLEDW